MRASLLAPVRIVQVPQDAVTSRRHVTQPYLAGDATTRRLRELPPHLELLKGGGLVAFEFFRFGLFIPALRLCIFLRRPEGRRAPRTNRSVGRLGRPRPPKRTARSMAG